MKGTWFKIIFPFYSLCFTLISNKYYGILVHFNVLIIKATDFKIIHLILAMYVK